MSPFHAFKGIEVSGRVVFGLVQAFGQFKAIASQLLLDEEIGQQGADGLIIADPMSWYAMAPFLRAFTRAGRQMGDSVLHQIGVFVAKNAAWAPNTRDVKAMTEQMDKAYHLNHRKDGQAMWDPTTDRLLEGIGHYRFTPRPDGAMEIEATNPYPCAFDKGLIFGGMRMLQSMGSVLHDEAHSCRKHGHASCIYVVRG